MRLPRARVLTASAVALAVGVGVPTAMAASASAATSSGSTGSATNAPSAPSLTTPVTGTFTNADGTGTFAGTFTPTAFSVVNGVLEGTGVLKGTLTDADGSSLGSVDQTTTLPVQTAAAAAAPAACNVLNLVLGPLNLNLLGLVVTLNEVHLNITAVPGSLLGDLLCDISGLLNGGGALTGLAALLNELLALL
jgi:hypothetical protein